MYAVWIMSYMFTFMLGANTVAYMHDRKVKREARREAEALKDAWANETISDNVRVL